MPMLPGAAYKTYVTVDVQFTSEGTMLPRSVEWEDGKC